MSLYESRQTSIKEYHITYLAVALFGVFLGDVTVGVKAPVSRTVTGPTDTTWTAVPGGRTWLVDRSLTILASVTLRTVTSIAVGRCGVVHTGGAIVTGVILLTDTLTLTTNSTCVRNKEVTIIVGWLQYKCWQFLAICR